MSSHSLTAPAVEKFELSKVASFRSILLIAGAVGIIGSLIGWAVNAQQFAFSWLFAFQFWYSLCVGCLFWTCLHHATDAEWTVVVRRQLENVTALIPMLVAFFLPILFNLDTLYRWWTIEPGVDALLDFKRGLLSLVAWMLRSNSVGQDVDGAARRSLLMRKFGIAGIPVIAVCLTFSAIDWLMALDHHWFSTMWGVYNFAGAAGASMALLVLIVSALRKHGYLKPVTMEHYHVMGKFLLAFTIFWAYIGFSQYMLIWYANIPEETVYFRLRNTGNWYYLSTLLTVGRFFLPFPILLTQWVKKAPEKLNTVAWWILAMQLLDVFIIVMPVKSTHGFTFWDLAFSVFPLVGIGGILGWMYLNNLSKCATFPTRDPRLAGSLKLVN
jgi:hypothetical protein